MTPAIQRARFTGEVINPGALCQPEAPEQPPFLPLNLYDLGMASLLHYVAGKSPYNPEVPLIGKPPRYWRLRQALVVIENRLGLKARSRFMALADKQRP
jgi:hypothetical protein